MAARLRLPHDVAVFAAYGILALVLTWPLAATLGDLLSQRGDYLQNLWNLWWVKRSLFELGTSPWWTDYLMYPDGISLGRYTLSLANTVPGAGLATWLGEPAAYDLLLLAHRWLSAWGAYLLAREVVGRNASGVEGGAFLAGIVYAFSPYHYHYMAQINVASTEILPFGALCFLRVWRNGRVRDALLAVGCTALAAALSNYYLVMLALFCGVLLALGRLAEPRTAWSAGAARLIVAGVCAACAVALVAWPLLREVLPVLGGTTERGPIAADQIFYTANDLVGFHWRGAPERVWVAWPTMLGFGSLAILAIGARAVSRQRFWCVVALVFWLLSLGPSLGIAGEPTGLPLPFAAIASLPLLSFLEAVDRFFVVTLLAVAVLVAAAWPEVERRLPVGASPRVAVSAVALLLAWEFCGAPLSRAEIACTPYAETLRRDETVEALVDLPLLEQGEPTQARAMFCQTLHERKIPQGYVTNLAVTERHLAAGREWAEALRASNRGHPAALAERMRATRVQVAVVNTLRPALVEPWVQKDSVVWKPFFFERGLLVGMRQRGPYRYQPLAPGPARALRAAARSGLGEPVYEDGVAAVHLLRASEGP